MEDEPSSSSEDTVLIVDLPTCVPTDAMVADGGAPGPAGAGAQAASMPRCVSVAL